MTIHMSTLRSLDRYSKVKRQQATAARLSREKQAQQELIEGDYTDPFPQAQDNPLLELAPDPELKNNRSPEEELAGALEALDQAYMDQQLLLDENAYLRCLVESKGTPLTVFVANLTDTIRTSYANNSALAFVYDNDFASRSSSAGRYLFALAINGALKDMPNTGLVYDWWNLDSPWYREYQGVLEYESALLDADNQIQNQAIEAEHDGDSDAR